MKQTVPCGETDGFTSGTDSSGAFFLILRWGAAHVLLEYRAEIACCREACLVGYFVDAK